MQFLRKSMINVQEYNFIVKQLQIMRQNCKKRMKDFIYRSILGILK